jgi:hypothetical protein
MKEKGCSSVAQTHSTNIKTVNECTEDMEKICPKLETVFDKKLN